jgi:pimeloyl-ACP methyl ester carboxylesterase
VAVCLYLIGCVVACCAVLLSLWWLDRTKTRGWISTPAPEGRLISMGGYQLFYRTAGNAKPVIVVFTGWSSPCTEWWPLQDQLARFSAVVTYDRAGYGRSEASPAPRSSSNVIEELHTLLKIAAIPGPYLLLAHSLGGLYAQHFARRYPNDVHAVILADPVSTDDHLFDELPCPQFKKFVAAHTRRGRVHFFRRLSQWGLLRYRIPALKASPAYGLYANLPGAIQSEFWENFAQVSSGRHSSKNIIARFWHKGLMSSKMPDRFRMCRCV